jgi:hypothetical protein
MKILFTLFIAFLSFTNSYGQIRISDFFDPTVARDMAISTNNRYSKVTGSPYINTAFINGFIGENKQPFLLRYNAESDAIELKFDEESIYIIPKETKFTNIVIGLNRYKLSNYTDLKGQFINGYLIEKTNGTVALLKREKIVIKPEKIATTSYETSEPAKFTRGSDEYYLKLKDNTIVAFPKNKKGILELFPAQKQAIEDFVKTNKTSFSNEQDLVKLTQFITGLLVE